MSNVDLYYPLFATATALLYSVVIFAPFTEIDDGTARTPTSLFDLTDTYDNSTVTALQGILASAFGCSVLAMLSANDINSFAVLARSAALLTTILGAVGMIVYKTNSDFDSDFDTFGAYSLYVAFGLSVITQVLSRSGLDTASENNDVLSAKGRAVVVPFLMALLALVALSYPDAAIDYNATGNMNAFIALWIIFAIPVMTLIFITGPTSHTSKNDGTATLMNFVFTLIPAVIFEVYAWSSDTSVSISKIQRDTILVHLVLSALAVLGGIFLVLSTSAEKAAAAVGPIIYLSLAAGSFVSFSGNIDYNVVANLNMIVCVWLVMIFSAFMLGYILYSDGDGTASVAGLLGNLAVLPPSIVYVTFAWFSDDNPAVTGVSTLERNCMTAILVFSALGSLGFLFLLVQALCKGISFRDSSV